MDKNYDVIAFTSKYLHFKKVADSFLVANFIDIIKIATTFIKTNFKDSKKKLKE